MDFRDDGHRGNAPRDPSGWRLPAPELETKVAEVIKRHTQRPKFCTGILQDATTEETAALGSRLASLGNSESGAPSQQ